MLKALLQKPVSSHSIFRRTSPGLKYQTDTTNKKRNIIKKKQKHDYTSVGNSILLENNFQPSSELCCHLFQMEMFVYLPHVLLDH